VAAILYYVLCRSLDIESEAAVAVAEQAQLEKAAAAHVLPSP